MMVLNTNLVFLATGSPSTSPGDLELVLLLFSIFFNSILKQLTLAFWIIEKNKNQFLLIKQVSDQPQVHHSNRLEDIIPIRNRTVT